MAHAPVNRSAYVMALEARLTDGYRRIDAAAASGVDVSGWEHFWLDLLDQYVAACDVMDAIAVAEGGASVTGDDEVAVEAA